MFESLIDPNIKEVRGKSVGETLILDHPDVDAHMVILGFDDAEIPIVEYKNVRYKTDMEDSRYGSGDAFEEGDIYPYPFDDFSDLDSL